MSGGVDVCDTESLLALTLLFIFSRGVLSLKGSGGENGWMRGSFDIDSTVQYFALVRMCRPLVSDGFLRFQAVSFFVIDFIDLMFEISFEHLSANNCASNTPSSKQELYISSKSALLEGCTSQLYGSSKIE